MRFLGALVLLWLVSAPASSETIYVRPDGDTSPARYLWGNNEIADAVSVTEAIDALPMGLAMKVALRANGPDRLDLPRHCSVDRQVARTGDPLMPFQCWPFGRDYVQGWIGGDHAWELARAGEAAAVDFALSYLRGLFGGRVDRLFGGGRSLVTRWDAEAYVRGAYCYARVGQALMRDRLAEPLADGRLTFAGEACNVPYAGTLAGAWISGQGAAVHALRAVRQTAG